MSDSIEKYFDNASSTIPSQVSYNKGQIVSKNGNNEEIKDPIVESVVEKFRERSRVGIQKYGTTLADSPDGFYAFVNHLQEELMDAVNYLETIKQQKF